MNERIRELAEQATIKEEYYPAGCNGYPEYRYDFDKEKFAELLIRECAGVCVEQRQYQPKEVYAQAVLSHFGVEE